MFYNEERVRVVHAMNSTFALSPDTSLKNSWITDVRWGEKLPGLSFRRLKKLDLVWGNAKKKNLD